MSDTQDDTINPAISDEIGPRIELLRDLISILAISQPDGSSENALPHTAETVRQLSQRLRRLLEIAGMVGCVQASESIEHAAGGLPSDESFRAIDALLAFLRARLDAVALSAPEASTRPVSDADETGGADGFSATNYPHDGAVGSSADSSDSVSNSFDESQFSKKTRTVLRNFRNATLRQRRPGEFSRGPERPSYPISDEVPEHMRRDFLSEEAAGDLASLRAALASFRKTPGSLDDLHRMSQIGHKIKGTAATYQYPNLAEILHAFEGVPRAFGPIAATRAEACLNLLIRFADVIEAALVEASDLGDASEGRLAGAQQLFAEAQALARLPAGQTAPVTPPLPGDDANARSEPIAAVPIAPEPFAAPATLQLPAIHRGGEDDTRLRVEPRHLDTLMHQADGLAMNRAMLAQASEEFQHAQEDIDEVLVRLASLSAQLTDLHPLIRQSDATSRAGLSGPRWRVRRETGGGTWDDLELDSYTAFDESLRALSEAVLDAATLGSTVHSLIQRLSSNSDVQRSVLHGMQQTIIHLRLVNLKPLADRVALAIHQVAQSSGKQVEISITGEETEIDRNISDELIAPILQLVRNAVAHGIESPDEREARGKPASGKIWLHALSSGSEVSIEVGDDGQGINPNQLIAAAVSARIVDAKLADVLPIQQALGLMFEQGLSTTENANVIAGHGIGLDSVLEAIQNLRGTIDVRSEQGRGTTFLIRVPISLSITRVLHVRVGTNEYAVPLSIVHKMFAVPEAGILVSLPDAEPKTLASRYRRRVRVARSSPEHPSRLPDDPTAPMYDEVPVFSLAELLGLEEQPRETHMALLVHVGQRQVAMLVDEVLDESEVVIRALPAHLRRRAVRGASIMQDGRLFLVLDVLDLLTDPLGGKSLPRPQPAPPPEEPRQRAPRVLVVDDSISLRRVLAATLAGAGYDVRGARDGFEALGMMLTELPDIMILDIEMPRLDGYELLSVIRGNESLAGVPVVILTSRAADKHYSHAIELGARAYLTKPCPDAVLIATLQRVLREQH